MPGGRTAIAGMVLLAVAAVGLVVIEGDSDAPGVGQASADPPLSLASLPAPVLSREAQAAEDRRRATRKRLQQERLQGPTPETATEPITPTGVGGVSLGDSYQELRARESIGPAFATCNTSGGDLTSALMKGSVRAVADLSYFGPDDQPRSVQRIRVFRGAVARGVGVGSTSDEVQAAFPQAKLITTPDADIYPYTLLEVAKGAGGQIQFAIDSINDKVTWIGIPDLVCLG